MRIGWIAMALLALNRDAAAAEVTVYVTRDGPVVTYQSQMIASRVLRKAGLTIDWRGSREPAAGAPQTSLQIELAAVTPAGSRPGALAVAYPYAGCSRRITVFMDRIRSLAGGNDRESTLLAYVLAHEIAHVIQRVDRHSDAGVMRAHWSAEDLAAIFEMRLGFAQEDILLVQRGLAAGWCRDPGTLMRRSE